MSYGRYVQSPVSSSETRFSHAPASDLEFSKLTSTPVDITTFDAGDIVPMRAIEMLPHETISLDLSFVIRPLAVKAPTMGQMHVDIYAFFVPNRVVNESWVNVMKENTSGEWTAPDVELVPLYTTRSGALDVQIPIGSVADHYGFPTQQAIPAEILQQMHDLKFRGYLEIYNDYFRDQNYQPPIPYSKLNVYEGFLENVGYAVSLDPRLPGVAAFPSGTKSDGSFSGGSVVKSLYGEGSEASAVVTLPARSSSWSALSRPLKANKCHDYFTSVAPSPQKGPGIQFNLAGDVPVAFDTGDFVDFSGSLNFRLATQPGVTSAPLGMSGSLGSRDVLVGAFPSASSSVSGTNDNVTGWNMNGNVDLSSVSSIDLAALRDGAAVQQVYEALSRGGSRYLMEFINTFFGVETTDPFPDIPRRLGHIRRNLDLYQVAQTTPTTGENGEPLGTLGAFGYTANGGHLFTFTALEHGYVHILGVVRHQNVYASFLGRDNFRRSMFDFYLPQMANISEQPVYTREINPFATGAANLEDPAVFGYQEAWAEYRYDPSTVSGLMRPGTTENLSIWNYADDFDSGLLIADGDWIKSNSSQVLSRTLATADDSSESNAQFKAQFVYRIVKELPMPTYSVPGLDIV